MDVVESILTNEKYKGDARLHKKFTADFLTKKMKVNEDEVPQYYVSGSPPGIIDPDEWDKVQAEMHRRKASGRRSNCCSPFSGMLFCGDCGEVYDSKVWHSTDQYRRVIWQCNAKFKKKKKCSTPYLTEEQIIDAYQRVLSELLKSRDVLYDDVRILMEKLNDCIGIDDKLKAVEAEMADVTALTKQCIDDNAERAQDQEEHNKRYASLVDRYDGLQKQQASLLQEIQNREMKWTALGGFIFEMDELENLEPVFTESAGGKRWKRYRFTRTKSWSSSS